METADQHANEQSKVGATPYESYVPGAKDSFGRVIKSVIGRHRQLVVYITDENAVGWNYDSLPAYLRPVIAEFQQLNGLARSTLGGKQFSRVALLMGPALYAGLLSKEGEDLSKHFEGSRTFICAKATQISRLLYVLLSTLFACIVVLLTSFACGYLAIDA